jgi:hypothetical protein
MQFENSKQKKITDIYQGLRHLSAQDFLSLGVADIAYVRPIKKGQSVRFEVRAADGSVLTTLPDYEGAQAAIVNNDMHAVTLQ